jgi:hypothetical protein
MWVGYSGETHKPHGTTLSLLLLLLVVVVVMVVLGGSG